MKGRPLVLTLPRWRFLNLQALLLGIGFLLLVGISAATVFLVERAASDSKQLADTLSVEDKLSDILLTVRRAESSQRGYLLTNDQSYLDDFRDAEPVTSASTRSTVDLRVALAPASSRTSAIVSNVSGSASRKSSR